ncbi:hypothetical protein YC2023_061003 [Brassica napus]
MEKKIRSGYRSCRRYVLSYLFEQWPEIIFDLNANIFNFGLFILEMITNLKPGEEQEDPERRYVE